MLPPPTSIPPDPLLQQNHSLAPQQIDFDSIAPMLQELSFTNGIWNGLRIGTVYGGLLGFLTSLCMESTYQQSFVLISLLGPDGTLAAVDFTPEMIARAQKRLNKLPAQPAITLHQADARATGLPAEHFDAVVCAFGINTMTPTQFDNMLEEIHRILRPGGIFGFVEQSRPPETQQRWMDRYLTGMVPALTDLLDIDARAHHLLNAYLNRFDNELLLPSFHRCQYTFYRYELFGGRAVAFVGMKDLG